MKLKFHGVRGSRPTHKPNLLGYGGNSTSIEFLLNQEDFYLFVDGGTGLVRRGREIAQSPSKKRDFHFLITHTHWDHIIGLPFFDPLYDANNHVTFYSSKTSKANFNDLFWGLQRADNLPVPVSKLKAQISFVEIAPGQSFNIGENVKVSTYQLNHQGVTLGYRVDYQGACASIITDNAPIERGNYLGENMPSFGNGVDNQFERSFNRGLVEFLRECHTVVYDTHFNEENLKPDWGHSSPQRAYEFCALAAAKRLLIFHHAPEDDDRDVKMKLLHIIVIEEAKIEIEAAKEGDEWELKSA